MYKALHLSPMIPSHKVEETSRFFREIFSFKDVRIEKSYAILSKDNLSIHILPAGNNIGQMEFYLEVDDIDVLWKSIEEKLKDMRVRSPFNREYGMREFHVEIPHTNTLLFVGQVIRL